jgi:hypothetical protein
MSHISLILANISSAKIKMICPANWPSELPFRLGFQIGLSEFKIIVLYYTPSTRTLSRICSHNQSKVEEEVYGTLLLITPTLVKGWRPSSDKIYWQMDNCRESKNKGAYFMYLQILFIRN